MEEICRWKNRDLFRAILREGKRTDLSPVCWHGCGSFQNIIVYGTNFYEHSVTFGWDRLIRIEEEDFSFEHLDPEDFRCKLEKPFDWRNGRSLSEKARDY